MLETVRIRRAGFSVRIEYTVSAKRRISFKFSIFRHSFNNIVFFWRTDCKVLSKTWRSSFTITQPWRATTSNMVWARSLWGMPRSWFSMIICIRPSCSISVRSFGLAFIWVVQIFRHTSAMVQSSNCKETISSNEVCHHKTPSTDSRNARSREDTSPGLCSVYHPNELETLFGTVQVSADTRSDHCHPSSVSWIQS